MEVQVELQVEAQVGLQVEVVEVQVEQQMEVVEVQVEQQMEVQVMEVVEVQEEQQMEVQVEQQMEVQVEQQKPVCQAMTEMETSNWVAAEGNRDRPEFMQASPGVKGGNRMAWERKVLGKKAKSGARGRDGQDGVGGNASDGGHGHHAEDIHLTNDAVIRLAQEDLEGRGGRGTCLDLIATGGDGGHGGDGGSGYKGSTGTRGQDATRQGRGTDGGRGGPGGPGGDAGAGGNSGNGGNITLSVDAVSSYLLMLFPQTVDLKDMVRAVLAGTPGLSGDPGAGGQGGDGGAGGASHSWTTTSTSTTKNAEGETITHTHTHNHFNAGGSTGPRGPSGPRGNSARSGVCGKHGTFRVFVGGRRIHTRYDLELLRFRMDDTVADGLFEYGEMISVQDLQIRNRGGCITPEQPIHIQLEKNEFVTPAQREDGSIDRVIIQSRLEANATVKAPNLNFAIGYPARLPPLDHEDLSSAVRVCPEAYQCGPQGSNFFVLYENFDNPLVITARYPVQEDSPDTVRVLGKGERSFFKVAVENISRSAIGHSHGRRMYVFIDSLKDSEHIMIWDEQNKRCPLPLILELPDMPPLGTDCVHLQVGWSEEAPAWTHVTLVTSLLLEPTDKGLRVPEQIKSHDGTVVVQRRSTKMSCVQDFELPRDLHRSVGSVVLVVSSEVPEFVINLWTAIAKKMNLSVAVWAAGRYGHVDPSARKDFAFLVSGHPCMLIVLDGAIKVRDHAGSVADLLDPMVLAQSLRNDAKILIVSPNPRDAEYIAALRVGGHQHLRGGPSATCQLGDVWAGKMTGSARITVDVSKGCCEDLDTAMQKATEQAAKAVKAKMPNGYGSIVRRWDKHKAAVDVYFSDQSLPEVFSFEIQKWKGLGSTMDKVCCRNLAMALPDSILSSLFWSLFDTRCDLPTDVGSALCGAVMWRLFREVRAGESVFSVTAEHAAAVFSFLQALLNEEVKNSGMHDAGPVTATPSVIEADRSSNVFRLNAETGRNVVDTPVGLHIFQNGRCELPIGASTVMRYKGGFHRFACNVAEFCSCFCSPPVVKANVLVLQPGAMNKQTAFALDAARLMVLAVRHCKNDLTNQMHTRDLLGMVENKFLQQMPDRAVPGGNTERFIKRREDTFYSAKFHYKSLEEYWTSLAGWWGTWHTEAMPGEAGQRTFQAVPKSGWNVFREQEWNHMLRAKDRVSSFQQNFRKENDSQRADFLITDETEFMTCPLGCGREVPVHLLEKHERWECRCRPQGLEFLLKQTQTSANLGMLTVHNIQMLANACEDGGVLEGAERERIRKLVEYLRGEFRLQQLINTPPEEIKYKQLVEAIDKTRKISEERSEAGLFLAKASEILDTVLVANLRNALADENHMDAYEFFRMAKLNELDIGFARNQLQSFAKSDLATACEGAGDGEDLLYSLTSWIRICYELGVPSEDLLDYEERLRSLKQLPDTWDMSEFVKQDDIERLTRKVDDSDPKTLARFQHLLLKTFKKVYTRDRHGGKLPSKLEVKKVTKVMNANLWQHYVMRRETVLFKDGWFAKKRQIVTGFPDDVPPPITRNWYEATRAEKLDPDLKDDLNEQWLFHGTSKAGADGITSDDFRLNLAGSNAGTLFGSGIYLAECCSKSDEYTSPDPATGLRPLILCRATLGNVLYTDELSPNTSTLEQKCGLGKKSITGYRSVLGDREKCSGTYREYVVYDNDLVYPAYVIWYRRCH